MFGRKKVVNATQTDQISDLEKIKSSIQTTPAIQSVAPQPVIPQQPIHEKTPFRIVVTGKESQKEYTYSPSGTKMETGGTVLVETTTNFHELSADEILDIISLGGSLAEKFRNVFKEFLSSEA